MAIPSDNLKTNYLQMKLSDCLNLGYRKILNSILSFFTHPKPAKPVFSMLCIERGVASTMRQG